MGVGDYISSLTGTVKSYTPDFTSVYGYTSNTISKVDNAVRTNVGSKLTGWLPSTESCAKIGQKVGDYLPDDEGRAKIGQFAWDFGKNAAIEGFKWVPGGTFVHKTIMQSLPDKKNENLKQKLKNENLEQKVKTMETRINILEKQLSASGNSQNQSEISSSYSKRNAENASLCSNPKMSFQRPEDVINIFMMKEFVGREISQQILDNLIVPGVGKHRE